MEHFQHFEDIVVKLMDTAKKTPSNSHYIAGMDDCLYHGQCKNIACQTCSKKKKVILICIVCLATNNNRSVNGSTHGVQKSTKSATKHAKSQQHMNSMKYWGKNYY